MHSRALLLTALLPLTAAAGCRQDETLAEKRLASAALEADRAAIRAELKELRAAREAAAAYTSAAYQPAAYQIASYSTTPETPADLVVDTIPSSRPGEAVAVGQQTSSAAPSIYIAPALRRPNPDVLDLREREIARRERALRLREAQVARAGRTVPAPAYREAEPVVLEPVAAKPAARTEPEATPDNPVVEPVDDGPAVIQVPPPKAPEPSDVTSAPQPEEVVPPPGS